MKTTNVNDEFFNSSYKHVWKKLSPPGLTAAEVDFIIDVANLTRGSRVADLMCGYGRHAVELAERGMDVLAVDILDEYIKEINVQTEQKRLSITTVQESVLNVQLTGNFDVFICMGNSFCFFDKEAAISIVEKIGNHLKKGGVLIINTWMISEIALKHFKEHDWHWAGDYKCILDYKYHFFPPRIESVQTIIAPDNSIEILKAIDYIFSIDEIGWMMKRAGLQLKYVYSTPRKRNFSLGDGQAYLVGEKI